MIQDNTEMIQSTFQELKKNFKSRMTYDVSFRKQQLKNLIKGIEEMSLELDEASKKDLGHDKFTNYMFSISICVGQIKYIIDNISNWSSKRYVDTPLLVGPGQSYIVPEPKGVVLVMGSWNYPLFTTIAPAASAIGAGNCVIVKPSEITPNSSKLIKKLFEKYVDNLFYRCVEGGVQVASNIIKLPLDLIVFTGSTEKGKLVAQAAAQNLVPTILELGGKSPTIVDEDANLENAALRITQGKFSNCGQTCVAPDYVFIHSKIKDKFLKKVFEKIKDFYGEDESKSVDYPRLVSVNYAKRIASLLEDNHEGKIIYGGKYDTENRYFQPTIVENPKHTSKMMKEEIFGPILPIYQYSEIYEVINFINQRDKPLALYYYGKKNKDIVNQQTSSGAYSINESIFHVAHLYMPFGGVQASGHGACNGKFGFDNCSHLKPVLDKLPLNSFPLSCRFPPYTTSKKAIMSNLLGYPALKQSTIISSVLMILMMIALILFSNTQTCQEIGKFINHFFTAFQKSINKK